MLTQNDVRIFRFLACLASFALPGLGHVLSSRMLAGIAWICVFFVTALGERLSILPLPARGIAGPVSHLPFLAPSLLLVVRLAAALELLLRQPRPPVAPPEWRRIAIVVMIFVGCVGAAMFAMNVLLRR